MNQKLLINLVVLLIMLAGFAVLQRINREAFPEVNFDMVTVTTIYPGGSPDELEQLVSIPIEEKLREVDGLDKVRTYNIENVSVVVAYISDTASDKPGIVQSIKDAVGMTENLPSKAEKPVVKEIKLDKKMVLNIAVSGARDNVPYWKIREAADDLKDFIYEIEGVAEVAAEGYYDREYLVEVNPRSLQNYRLGINTVINTLRNRNLDLPGGTIKVGDNEYVLRTKGQFRNADDVRNTVIMSNDAGFYTRVKDVAEVSDTFEDVAGHERYNGNEAVTMMIWKKISADEITLADELKKKMAAHVTPHADDVKIDIIYDWSTLTRNRISAVLTNFLIGLVIMAAILMALLGPRISAIVSVGIPLAFMIAFIGLTLSGLTLNVISLFGLIMVLGMIVDFSIVVAENSHRYMETGLDRFNSIRKGVSEVFWPVTVTFMCISAAFAPLLFLSGLMGKFIIAIPTVLIICLGASLFVAMFILPTHLNMFMKKEFHARSDVNGEAGVFEKGLFGKVQHRYQNLLEKVLRHRYITVGILLIFLIASLKLMGLVGFVFAPKGGAEQIQIKTYLPQGTNIDANLRQMKEIERIILKLPKSELVGVKTQVGVEESDGLDPKPGEGTHKSTFTIYLTPEKDRKRDAYSIEAELRRGIEAAVKQNILRTDLQALFNIHENGPPTGKPVNIEIRGKEFAGLKQIAEEYIAELKKIDGVRDITIDLEEGKQEYRYFIKEVMASQTGVSVYDIALSLNASFQGAVATSTRIGDENVDVRVRFPEEYRKQMKSLKEVMVSNNMGGLIPLDAVTGVSRQPGYSQINRLNYKRIVQVKANVDTDKITSLQVNDLLKQKFAEKSKTFNGYDIAYGGEQEDTAKTMGEMGLLFLFALFVIYIILAVFFKSLILPGVVMSAIPFALVGVVLAVLAHGQMLSFSSFLGIFSLAGVIVSNTLVLVQFINNQRDEGLGLKDALIQAGVIRLRPVILTAGTTVLALFPTIYGIGGKDYFVAPLALSFGYGLVFATVITLLLIPSFYYIAEDIKMKTASIIYFFSGVRVSGTIYESRKEL
jgi:multidrug efflux pump subunit AcrB